ncbi:hypothetical protein BH11BAC5_BH11BAC5_33990 [soil metagenome]
MAKAKAVFFIKQAFFITSIFLFALQAYCQINIGQNINQLYVLTEKTNTLLMTSPSSLEKRFKIKKDSTIYFVTISEHKLVTYISTSDSHFTTSDSLKVGTYFSKIRKEKILSEIIDYKGWGKFIRLSSGWNAVFDFQKPVTASSKIEFFFKN